MNVKDYMQQAGKAARKASRELARADTAQKNRALLAMADAILREQAQLLAANAQDMEAARKAGLEPALLDRLALNEKPSPAWPKACARSPRCRTRWARSAKWPIARPAFSWARCGCRWAWWASFTRRVPTSPPTPPACA